MQGQFITGITGDNSQDYLEMSTYVIKLPWTAFQSGFWGRNGAERVYQELDRVDEI